MLPLRETIRARTAYCVTTIPYDNLRDFVDRLELERRLVRVTMPASSVLVLTEI
jgi:hypothetical protein